jgi:hypothetical protein
VPGVLFAATRRARCAVPGPVDEPAFFLGDVDIVRAAIRVNGGMNNLRSIDRTHHS